MNESDLQIPKMSNSQKENGLHAIDFTSALTFMYQTHLSLILDKKSNISKVFYHVFFTEKKENDCVNTQPLVQGPFSLRQKT